MERAARPTHLVRSAHALWRTMRFAALAGALAFVGTLALACVSIDVGATSLAPQRAFADETASSPCVPTAEQLATYAADGTFDERSAFQEALGNDQPSAGLVRQAIARQSAEDGMSPLAVPSDSESGMATEGAAHVLAVRMTFEDYDTFAEGDTLEALQALIGPKVAGDSADSSAGLHPYESLSAYYERASYGRLSITGETFDYHAPHPRSYYDTDSGQMFKDALDYLDGQGVDFSRFDANNDGRIDAVYIHFAGPDTGWGSTWWSNEAVLSHVDAVYDGVRLWNAVALSRPSNEAWAAQTIIHETGHVLGLPDYYSYMSQTSGSSERTGILTFDMMMNNLGDHNGFSKWMLGWLDEADVTRVIANDEGIVVKQGQTVVERVEASGGEARVQRALEAFTSDTVDDTGGIVVVSNEDGGLFSSYYLLQYDRAAGNQTVRYGFDGEGANLPSGFRLFRVQAQLDSGGFSFVHTNAGGSVYNQLIELVDPDMGEQHGETALRVPSSIERSDYGCMLFAGDSVSPTSSPSTNFYENRAVGFTGLTLAVDRSDPESGTVSISYSAREKPDPTADFKLVPRFDSISPIGELVFEASSAPLRSLDPELFPRLVIDGKEHALTTFTISGTTIAVPCLLDAESINASSTCEIVFPAGQFIVAKTSSETTLSPEIRLPLSPKADLATVELGGYYDGTEHLLSLTALSDVFAFGDGSRCFFQLADDTLKLHTIYAKDPTRLTTTSIVATNVPTMSEHLALSAVPLSNDEVFLSVVDEETGDGSAYWIDRATGTATAARSLEFATRTRFAASGRNVAVAYSVPLHGGMLLGLLSPQSDGSVRQRLGRTSAELATSAGPNMLAFGFRDDVTGLVKDTLIVRADQLVEALQSGASDIGGAEQEPEACTPERVAARLAVPNDRITLASQATETGLYLLLSSGFTEVGPTQDNMVIRYDLDGVEQARATIAFDDGFGYSALRVGEHGTVALVATTSMREYNITRNDVLFCDANLKPRAALTTSSTLCGLWLADGRWIGIGTRAEGAAGQKGSPVEPGVEPGGSAALSHDAEYDPNTRAYYSVTTALDKAPVEPVEPVEPEPVVPTPPSSDDEPSAPADEAKPLPKDDAALAPTGDPVGPGVFAALAAVALAGAFAAVAAAAPAGGTRAGERRRRR